VREHACVVERGGIDEHALVARRQLQQLESMTQVPRTQFGGSTRARDLRRQLDLDAAAGGHVVLLE
jgi:hypothetical protein